MAIVTRDGRWDPSIVGGQEMYVMPYAAWPGPPQGPAPGQEMPPAPALYPKFDRGAPAIEEIPLEMVPVREEPRQDDRGGGGGRSASDAVRNKIAMMMLRGR